MKAIYISLGIFLVAIGPEVFAQSQNMASEPIAKSSSMYWDHNQRTFYLFRDKCPQKDLAQRYGYRAEFHDKKFQTVVSVINACYFLESNNDAFFIPVDGGKEIRIPYAYFEYLHKSNIAPTVAKSTHHSSANNCYQSLESQQSLSPIRNKVPLAGGKPSLEMLANDSKPNKSEKKAIGEWEAGLSQCNELAKDWGNSNLNPQANQLLQNNFTALRS